MFAYTAPVSGAGSRAGQTSLPWSNWSGGLTCQPAGRFSPESETRLSEYLASTSGAIRPVGSGHSFSPLVPTDGHLIVIDQLAGVLAHDADNLQVTAGARAIHANSRQSLVSTAIMLGALIAGVASGNSDVAQAGAVVGQGTAAQAQINFTRSNE